MIVIRFVLQPNLDKPEPKFCHFARDFGVECLKYINPHLSI